MKKLLALFLLLCGTVGSTVPAAAQHPPEFPEPAFVGLVHAIRADGKTIPLLQESVSIRQRASTGYRLFRIGRKEIHEITLNGAHSPIRFDKEEGIALMVCVSDNRIDPMSAVSVFRFKTKRKSRVAEYASVDTSGGSQFHTLDRIHFTAYRFGLSSYLLILAEVDPGEYGLTITGMQPDNLTVTTFGVDK